MIKNIIDKIRKTLSKKKLECLFLVGLLTVTITNFTINIKFACYFIGIVFMLFSIYLDFIKTKRR